MELRIYSERTFCYIAPAKSACFREVRHYKARGSRKSMRSSAFVKNTWLDLELCSKRGQWRNAFPLVDRRIGQVTGAFSSGTVKCLVAKPWRACIQPASQCVQFLPAQVKLERS